jgi:hypothetical protein
MMASNVSILDTEVAQAIVLLGIEGRLVEVVGRLGGPGERPDHDGSVTCPAATQSGSFLLDVDLVIDSATKPIKSSPFRITIFPGHAIPETTQVVPGGSAGQIFSQTTVKFTSKARQWATFVVRSHDRFKNPLNAGGDHFVARIHGNTDIVSSEKRVEVIDQGCVSCSSTSVMYAINIL